MLPAPDLDDRRFQDLVDDAKRLVQQAALSGPTTTCPTPAVVFTVCEERLIPPRHLEACASSVEADQLRDHTEALAASQSFSCFDTEPQPGDCLYTASSAPVRAVATSVPTGIVTVSSCGADSQKLTSADAAVGGNSTGAEAEILETAGCPGRLCRAASRRVGRHRVSPCGLTGRSTASG